MLLTKKSSKYKESGKLGAKGTIGFAVASHWLKKMRENFKPITRLIIHNQMKTVLFLYVNAMLSQKGFSRDILSKLFFPNE